MLGSVAKESCLGEEQEWKVDKIQPCTSHGVKDGYEFGRHSRGEAIAAAKGKSLECLQQELPFWDTVYF